MSIYIVFTKEMADSWVEHSLEFESQKQTPQQKQTPPQNRSKQTTLGNPPFAPAEATWQKNDSSFQIEQSGDTRAERQRIYLSRNTLPNLQKQNEYTTEVRNDPSYQFLMMVAAFSKRKLGSVLQITPNARNQITRCQLTTSVNRSNNAHGWLLMPEISGTVQLSPEIYGHIKEAEQILSSFGRSPTLKTLIEDGNYQTLFARLVAVRMGLSDYLSHSEKAKDRIFIRLHQEQTMLLRRLGHVVIPYNRQDWSRPNR